MTVVILAGLAFGSLACPLFVLWDETRRPDKYRGWGR